VAVSLVSVSAACPTAQLTNTTAAGSNLSVEYPASDAVGNILVACLQMKASDGASSDWTEPTDWTGPASGNNTGGTGSYAADTGTVRARAMYHVLTGDVSGSLAFPDNMTTGSACGFMFQVASSISGATWDVAMVEGADAATGTPFGGTAGAGLDIAAGDFVFACGATPTDVNAGTTKYSSPTLTAAGLTPGAGTNFYTGNYPNTSHSNDNGGTTTNIAGPFIIGRLREVPPPRLVLPPSRVHRRAALVR
jgi:hypothetical protein